MTALSSHREPAVSEERTWGFSLLVPEERGRRNRRTIDGVLFAVAAALVGLAAVVARAAPDVDDDIGRAVVTVFGWAPGFWRAVLLGTLALSLAVLADAVLRRRWLLVRDVLIAIVVVNATGSVLARIVDFDWLQISVHLLSRWGFPELRIAHVVAVIAVARPELVRPVRVLGVCLVGLASLGVLALGIASPAELFGGLALGLGAGAIVRLAFGSPLGVPPTERVRAALQSLGVDIGDLRIAAQQHVGAADFFGRDGDGGEVRVRVLGRDAQDTQRLARRWRLLAYRDPPRSAPVGRLEQVEHEALTTLMAEQAGVRVPQVVTVGVGPHDDAVLVTRQPDVAPLELSSADDVTDALLEELWRQVERLQRADISHGRLNASNVLVTAEGPMLVDFSAATLGAPQFSLDIDVAELLVACTVLVGPERALRKAVDAGWGASIARALPYLQRAALTPHLRDLARSHEVALNELRSAAAGAAGVVEPQVVPLYRIRRKDLLLMAALILAAYLLISQLASIGFATIAHELGDAQLVWVVIALLLAQSTFVPSAISVRGGVATPLPLLPCVVLQSAIKFVNLTVPSSAGRVATNLRCLQRMGASRAEAIAGGALDDVSNNIVGATLFALTLPFVGADLDTSEFQSAGPDRRLLVAIGIALAVSALVVFAIPRVRARVLPGMRDALRGLWNVARVRRKRIEVFAGSAAADLLTSLALGATCLAYGLHLNIAQLIFITESASVLSSIVPVPGGIGAAEAALSAGLIAMGVDESSAFAVAITQRLCTFYLPPIWGYFSLRWLARHGYV